MTVICVVVAIGVAIEVVEIVDSADDVVVVGIVSVVVVVIVVNVVVVVVVVIVVEVTSDDAAAIATGVEETPILLPIDPLAVEAPRGA